MRFVFGPKTPGEIGRDIGRKRRRRKLRMKLLTGLAEAQNQRCAYCHQRFDEAGEDSAVTLDHVQARCHGGLDTFENCVAACRGCNSTRRHMNPTKFAKAKARATTESRAFPPSHWREPTPAPEAEQEKST